MPSMAWQRAHRDGACETGFAAELCDAESVRAAVAVTFRAAPRVGEGPETAPQNNNGFPWGSRLNSGGS